MLIGSPDGLHPDVAGYHRMADAIEPMVRRVLAARQSGAEEASIMESPGEPWSTP
jgi:hypothetical protein